MKAMIFAAGLGTRLRPITNTRPKALVEINGVSLLERAFRHLRSAGVSEVIVNAHHFAERIAAFLRAQNNFGMRVEISYEEVLLDTGGGLKKAAWFFDDGKPFFVHNADVISRLDLLRMYRFHEERNALATLAVKPRATKRPLVFDEEGKLCGRKEVDSSFERGQGGVNANSYGNQNLEGTSTASLRDTSTANAQTIPSDTPRTLFKGGIAQGEILELAFDGIHVISPALLDMMPEEVVFSIIATYLRLAAAGEKILAFRTDEYYWRDVGKLEELEQIAAELARRESP